jgi:hypothetical protein
MAAIQIVGFESGTLVEVGGGTGTCAIDSTTKRSGDYSLRVNPTTTANGYVSVYSHGASGALAVFSLATAYYRFYLNIATLPSSNNEEIAEIFHAGGIKMTVRITSAGKLQAYATDGTTQLGSDGSTTLSAGATWYRIEISCATGTTAAYEVKIDGTSELSGTGNLNAANNAFIRLGKATDRNGKSVDFYYDDVQINDAAFPGAGAVLRMDPDGDGTYTTWTVGAGGGSDWENVDEVPPDNATTYLLSTSTSTNASTVTLESCATVGISGTIAAAKACHFVSRIGSRNGAIRLRVRSNATDYDTGTSYTSVAAWVSVGSVMAVDPATSAAWTTGGLDAAEIGCIEYSANKSGWTAGYMMVEFVAGGAAPQTVNLSTGASTVGGKALSITAGAVTLTLNKGASTASGKALTLTKGAVTLTLNTGASTASGKALTITKGGKTITLAAGASTVSGKALTITTGGKTVTLNVGNSTVSGKALTVTKGGISITLDAGSSLVDGKQLSITPGAYTVDLDTGNSIATGQPLTIAKGGVTVNLDTGASVATGQPLTVSKGAITITLDAGASSVSGKPLTVTPGATIVNLDTGASYVTGLPLTVTPTGIIIALDTGLSYVDGKSLSVLPGGIVVVLGAGNSNVNGLPIGVTATAAPGHRHLIPLPEEDEAELMIVLLLGWKEFIDD